VRALVLNCTLKPSPAPSNTEALAEVVIKALEGQGVTTELVRVADYEVRPWTRCCRRPTTAWTYWNKGPGPGPSYTETDEGHEWSASTGEAATANLVAVARALEAAPMQPPPSA
jgi:hypothetical protein